MTAAWSDKEIELEAWRDALQRNTLILFAAMAAAAAYYALYVARNVLSLEFLLLVAAAAVATTLHAIWRAHPHASRAVLYVAFPLLLSVLLLTTAQPWVAYLAAPLILVAALARPGAELIALVTIVAAAMLNAQTAESDGQLLPVIIVLGTTTVIAYQLRQSIDRTFDWYAKAGLDAHAALESARSHRAQLASALKTERIALAIQERARLEILQAKHQADEAKRMKEQFAANISHELRTPLNIILGFSELMHSSPHVYGDDPFPPKLRRDVSHIYYSCKHLVNLIDDILDLSRFESSEFQLTREITSVDAIVKRTLETARDIFGSSPVELIVRDMNDLPTLWVDSTRIQQVLLNLLTNAHRHTRQGSVTISAFDDGHQVVMSVRDTGRGIPAHELNRIFEEFYQVDLSLSRPYQGAGLGLAICRRLVEAHGGRIWAESIEGEGACFHLALPHGAQYPRSSKQSDGEAGHQSSSERKGERVVALVDPDPALAALLERNLIATRVKHIGSQTSVAGSEPDARVDAVVMNVPVDARAGEMGQGIPIISCSLPSRGGLMGEYGIDMCLTKPVTSSQITAAMEHFGSPRSIVMVDDDRGFCHLIGQVLGNLDPAIRFESAYGVDQGIRLVEEMHPDLLIVDLMLGEEDGRDLLRRVRGTVTPPTLPVLLLTATDSTSNALDFRCTTISISRQPGFAVGEVLRVIAALTETCCDAAT